MDKNNLLITISVISMFTSLFLALFLVTVNTKHKLSNRLFAFFLVLSAIDMVGNLDSLTELPLTARIFISTLFFLQLPTFYLYVLSVCYSDFKLNPKYLKHSIPFLLSNLILLPRFYSVSPESKIRFIKIGSSTPEIQFNHILMHFQVILYIIAAFVILRRARKIYLENYTGATIESLTWLFQFTLALSIFYFIALLKNIFKFTPYPNISEYLKTVLLIFELITIFWYLYKALNNPDLFRNINSKLKLVSEIISEKQKIEQEILNEDLLKLKKYMLNEKPFLNPALTIQDISKEMKIPVRELSVLINHQLGQHFYEYFHSVA